MLIKSTLFYSGSSRHSCMHSSVCCTQKALHAHHTRAHAHTHAVSLSLRPFFRWTILPRRWQFEWAAFIVQLCHAAHLQAYANTVMHMHMGLKTANPVHLPRKLCLSYHTHTFQHPNAHSLVLGKKKKKKLTFNSHRCRFRLFCETSATLSTDGGVSFFLFLQARGSVRKSDLRRSGVKEIRGQQLTVHVLHALQFKWN